MFSKSSCITLETDDKIDWLSGVVGNPVRFIKWDDEVGVLFLVSKQTISEVIVFFPGLSKLVALRKVEFQLEKSCSSCGPIAEAFWNGWILFIDERIVQLVLPVSDDVPSIVNSEERYIESPFLGDVILTSGRLKGELSKGFP